jgi:hypothetical protein
VANEAQSICRIIDHGAKHPLAGPPTGLEAASDCYSVCIDVEAVTQAGDIWKAQDGVIKGLFEK